MGLPVWLLQRQAIALEIEVVEGTAETLAGADLIAPIFEPEWVPNFTMAERRAISPSFSKKTQISGERSGTIRFATELKGSGTAGNVPPNLSKALRACGFAETIVATISVTYAPASENVPSVTMELFESGSDGTDKRHRIIGARGTVSFEAVKGSPVLARFEFTGRYVEPDEAVLLTPQPVPTPLPVSFLGAAFTFQGVGTLRVQNVTLDMANTVVMRNDANEATGNFSGIITDRVPVGSIDPEQVLISEANFFNDLTTNKEGILQYVLGSAAGNIVTVNVPKAQIINITPGDRDGIRIESMDIELHESAVAGDDEISIAMT